MLFVALGAGCATIPSDVKTTVLSLSMLHSGQDGGDLAKALRAREGIYQAVFSQRKAELRVIADPSLDVLAAANSVKGSRESYGIAVGAGRGSYEAWEPAPEGLDVKVVSEGGADVKDLAPFTVVGKTTIIDFSAKWCEPCRMLDAHILELMETRSDVAYRKLEVLDWDSPLAVHYMKDVGQLPYVIIFDKAGRSIAEVSGFDTQRIDAAIEVARRSP